MRFAKYHGLGNDFLVVDLRDVSAADAAAAQDPARVIALCDRQFGVGGDGVLAILPSATADARMRVLNSDGSEAEMCGNGLRCVVQWLHDHGGVAKEEMAIDTGAGRHVCELLQRNVTVSMGAPRLLRGEIPMVGPLGASVGLGLQTGAWMIGGQLVGFASGEWRGSDDRLRKRIYLAILCLIAGMIIMVFGNLFGKAW